jgi:hypothetical protein
LWNATLVIAKDLVWCPPVEQRQGRAVPANLHQLFDQAFDGLVLAQFSFETLAKRIHYRVGQRFSGAASQRSR